MEGYVSPRNRESLIRSTRSQPFHRFFRDVWKLQPLEMATRTNTVALQSSDAAVTAPAGSNLLVNPFVRPKDGYLKVICARKTALKLSDVSHLGISPTAAVEPPPNENDHIWDTPSRTRIFGLVSDWHEEQGWRILHGSRVEDVVVWHISPSPAESYRGQ